MYIARRWSNSSLGAEYDVDYTSAMRAAKEIGHAEMGEVIVIIDPETKRRIDTVYFDWQYKKYRRTETWNEW